MEENQESTGNNGWSQMVPSSAEQEKNQLLMRMTSEESNDSAASKNLNQLSMESNRSQKSAQ
jgi:hypothetical protein